MALNNIVLHDLNQTHESDRVRTPVAWFHLGNGAQTGEIVVGADGSWYGLNPSLGVMVSYQYQPEVASIITTPTEDLDSLLQGLCSGRRVA
ncbi:MAG: hypothetical protein EP343_03035 [Deltaproteobacteria bacterium]|nr:MAG: hypothetical protein EP343_03035 [Deltaproteobacteria bacterium]